VNILSTVTSDLTGNISGLLQDLFQASQTAPVFAMQPSLEHLREELSRLLAGIRQIDAARWATGHPDVAEVSELGERGAHLLADLRRWAARLELPGAAYRCQAALLSLAAWIARQQGYLRALELTVNTLADFANQTREPDMLFKLSRLLDEIVEAVPPAIKRDDDKQNFFRPWRILLVNYAIVATRSHRPEAMEQAFDSLLAYLPEEAPRFFSEGMEQMVALDYPPQARAVMENYARQWVPRSLH
jgi:hypothetical protein